MRTKNLTTKLTAIGVSAAAAIALTGTKATGADPIPELPEKTTLEKAVDRQQAVRAYESVFARAKKEDVEPKVNAAEQVIPVPRLERRTDLLRKQVEKAEAKPDFPTPESVGVPQATLAEIASCESGGDYTTNTGNGFSGAYQFMDSTWQAVGGSTASAYQATPEEQDYRAALLYSRSGPGQWPVCGA